MRAPLLPLTLLTLARRALAQPEQLPPFPNATSGAFFSGVFSDRAVLQRAPRSAVLYGVVIGATPSTTVTVTLQDGGSGPDEAQAPVQARRNAAAWSAPIAAAGTACAGTACLVLEFVTTYANFALAVGFVCSGSRTHSLL